MAYKVKWENTAIEILDELDNSIRERIIVFFDKVSIKENPRSSGKPLTGTLKGLWRYRVGDYRIIADIQNDILVVLILYIAHRSVVYKINKV